jgi:peptide/nickel transport system substrate-binding protein
VGLGAVLLTACGGESNSTTPANKANLVTEAVDSSRQAKMGGIIKDRTFGDTPSLDPYIQSNPWNAIGPHVYSTLVQQKPGYLALADGSLAPDIAESWETSPDGLQITLKLRQGVKWHNKAPVSGRLLDSDDVVASWTRFAAKSPARTGVANSASPQAPVLSLAATDARTIVMKLKEPLVYALALFASNSSGNILMLPKEIDSGFDPRGEMIGTGPYMLSNYVPSASFTLKRNADYYDANYARADAIEIPIISEYAAALGQFKAGNIYSFGSYASTPMINGEDVLTVKQDEPRISVYQSDYSYGGAPTSLRLAFGWLPAGKSPFLDERVRQAVSLSLDRELYIDTFLNVSKFNAQGLAVDTRWHTSLAATYEGWWLDPKGKDFRANAQYFRHDIGEAKKLLAAAGYPNGIKGVTSSYVTGPEYPAAKYAQVMDNMIAEAGIASVVHAVDYAKEYIPQYRDASGRYDGWAYHSTVGTPSGGDPVGELSSGWWSKAGVSFFGFDAANKGDQSGDPQVDSMIAKARIEQDTEKRRALVYDIQRYLAKPMYALYPPGIATSFTVAWPCLANFRVYRGARVNYGLWLDQSKPPFKNA